MDPVEKAVSLFDRKVVVSEEFETHGVHVLVKPLECYEEYVAARSLVEQLSRCSTWHCRLYVEGMLRLPSYYPFVVVLLDDKSFDMSVSSPSCYLCPSPDSSCVDDIPGESTTVSTVSPPRRGKIVGYMEVYLLPHLGRSCDSRLERVVVDPLYRNRGICQAMVKFAIGFCKDVLCCNRIDMICDNPVAIRIYTKFGFELVNTNVYRKSLS